MREEAREKEMLENNLNKPEPPTILSLKVVLKPLLNNLEYAFLGEGETLPVVISLKLEPSQNETLVELLRKCTEANAWKFANLKGICPTMCTYKILMKDNNKLVVQLQQRLNPKMSQFLKYKVVHLLDVGIIYPISDSPYASPI